MSNQKSKTPYKRRYISPFLLYNNRTDQTTDDEISDESDVINHYSPSASGLISGFVERRYVEYQEDIHDEKL